jgi:hypothetical protein
MRGSLGQPIIIENVTGADGSVGVGRAARAAPDGYTIEIGHAATHVLNGALYSLQYDLLNDFAPISLLATAPLILFGRKTIPAKDLGELVAWLKINPNKASAGYGAAGSHRAAASDQAGRANAVGAGPRARLRLSAGPAARPIAASAKERNGFARISKRFARLGIESGVGLWRNKSYRRPRAAGLYPNCNESK